MLSKYFKISLRNLKVRPLRSWLTILGIVMGVFLVTALLSLSEGLKDSVLRELRTMGGNVVVVFPGDMSDPLTAFLGGMTLDDRDIDAIRRARGVEAVVPTAFSAQVVRYEGESKTTFVNGFPYDEGSPILRDDMGWNVVEGRWPQTGRREVLVGNAVPHDIFPELQPGDTIYIKGVPFEVAGVLRSLGNRQDDAMVAMDMNDYITTTGKSDGASVAMAKIQSGYDADEVAENISIALEDTRRRVAGQDSAPFSVLTSGTAEDMVGNVMGAVQLAVFGIASIAVIVGGIGIMNTMYTSVYERIREIGILKAVGAKKRDVLSIFLIESAMIGLIGGLGGFILGIAAAKSVELYAQVHPVFIFEAVISPFVILVIFIFSFLIGGLSGFFPARKAAALNPVDALRYE